MSSFRVEEALHNPQSILKKLYVVAGSESFPEIVSSAFLEAFSSSLDILKIPSMASVLKTGPPANSGPLKLVRLRAMIQSSDSEVYPSMLSDGRLAGWGISYDDEVQNWDDLTCDDRTTAWAVRVPGASPWVAESDTPADMETTSLFPDKFPLPGMPHIGVTLKIYGDSSQAPKLTQVFTFVGVVNEEPVLTSNLDSDQEEILAPTLHVIFSVPDTSFPKGYTFPLPESAGLLPPNGDIPALFQASAGLNRAQTVRNAVIQWIAEEALGGDIEAATWVLLAVISRTYSRTPLITPLSLTLANFPNPPPLPSANASIPLPSLEPTIKPLLELLLPAVIHVPLSINYLNTQSFSPISDDDTLHSGILQLPTGTTVIISDAAISEGTLNDRGVRNVDSLRRCITSQTLVYRYPYSEYNLDSSINFIILAQGNTSPFAETQFAIPIRPRSNFELYKAQDQINLPPKEVLESFRDLIGGARIGKVAVTEEISEHVENDFVRERQADKSVNSDDLISWMSIARLMALSRHETEITKEVWDLSKELNKTRLERYKA